MYYSNLRALAQYIIIFFVCLCSQSLSGQLINIENKRMLDDSIRFTFSNHLGFNLTSNNGDYIYQISNNITTQFKPNNLKHNFFFTGNYNVIRSQEKDFNNNWMLHFRYNYRMSNHWRFEGFLQTQNDELLEINSRQLTGFGLRFKAINDKSAYLNLGTTYMYEREESVSAEQTNFFHRSSNYCAFGYTFNKSQLEISNTIYFQPLYIKLNDYRLLNEFLFSVGVTEFASITANFIYARDNVTPSGISQTSLRTHLGFRVTL